MSEMTAVPTSPWGELAPTLPGDWDDEATEVDLVPAGVIAPVKTLPPLELEGEETVVFFAREVDRI
jgi:hypothetical protein